MLSFFFSKVVIGITVISILQKSNIGIQGVFPQGENGDIFFMSTPVPVRTKLYHYLGDRVVVIRKREQKKNISTRDIGAAY